MLTPEQDRQFRDALKIYDIGADECQTAVALGKMEDLVASWLDAARQEERAGERQRQIELLEGLYDSAEELYYDHSWYEGVGRLALAKLAELRKVDP